MLGEWIKSAWAMLGRVAGGNADHEPRRTAGPMPRPAATGSFPVLEDIGQGRGPAWGTLSGLTAHPTDPARLYAVTDQDSAPLRIIEIDVSISPPQAVRQILISAPSFSGLDFEGIVGNPQGGFWLASEGGKGDLPPNVLIEVNAEGAHLRSIRLPQNIANRVQKKGFEGVALEQTPSGRYLHVAFQGPLAGDPDTFARIGTVDVDSGRWTFAFYPLERSGSGDVTGLSEILHLGERRFAAIERDGAGGRKAIKWVTTFDLGTVVSAAPDADPPRLKKRIAIDLASMFTELGRKVEKEIEGLAVAADGQLYAVTDNDGERATVLMRLGPVSDVLRR